MIARALVVWCALLGLAIANGAVREAWILPRTADATGHAISTGMLCVLILLLSWALIRWIRPIGARDAWSIGGVWLGFTLAFEFLAGHYVFGNPWGRLLEDYNILRGRIWVLVLVTTLVAPWLAGRARGLLTTPV
jgi:hypothetical protein